MMAKKIEIIIQKIGLLPGKFHQSPYRQWIQCNQGEVKFESSQTDQFTHNFEKCSITATRKDGSHSSPSPYATASVENTFDPDNDKPVTCKGKLKNIQHGQQTITFEPKDICGVSTNTHDLVWDTDLPSTFKSQKFTQKEYWFNNTTEEKYTIPSTVPAANDKGKFPKHYTIDCFESQYCSKERTDGNSRSIECNLESLPLSTNDSDGCNPGTVEANITTSAEDNHHNPAAQQNLNLNLKIQNGLYTWLNH